MKLYIYIYIYIQLKKDKKLELNLVTCKTLNPGHENMITL